MKKKQLTVDKETIEKNSALIRDFITRLQSGEIKYNQEGVEEVLRFCENIQSNNLYTDSIGEVYKCVQVEFKDKSQMAEYELYYGTVGVIKISNNLIYKLIKGEESVIELIDSVFHEYRHGQQQGVIKSANLKKVDDETREKVKSMAEDIEKTLIKPEQIDAVISLFGNKMSKEYQQYYNSLTSIEKQKRCKLISHAYYNKLHHEEDARRYALYATRVFCDNLLKDSRCDKRLRNYIINKFENFKKLVKNEEIIETDLYKLYEEFDKQMRKISVKDLIFADSVIRRDELSFLSLSDKEYKRESVMFKKLNQTYAMLTQELLQSCSYEEKQELLHMCMVMGADHVEDVLLVDMKNDKTATKKQKAQTKMVVKKLLLSKEIASDTAMCDYSKLFSDKELTEIVTELIDKNRFRYALGLYSNSLSISFAVSGVKTKNLEQDKALVDKKNIVKCEVLKALYNYVDRMIDCMIKRDFESVYVPEVVALQSILNSESFDWSMIHKLEESADGTIKEVETRYSGDMELRREYAFLFANLSVKVAEALKMYHSLSDADKDMFENAEMKIYGKNKVYESKYGEKKPEQALLN